MLKWIMRAAIAAFVLLVVVPLSCALLLMPKLPPPAGQGAVQMQPPAERPASAPADPPARPFAHVADTSPQAKADRDKLITKLQGLGVFGDLKLAGGVGKVVAGPAFDGLEFDQREKFASVAFAWCLDRDPDCTVLVVVDRFTGKQIGKMSAWSDFTMD